jgi:peptide deformylase
METKELLKLVASTDPILKTNITEDTEGVAGWNLPQIIEQLHETRKANRALGLAANQVGIPLRIFVMGNDFCEFTCINPEIIEQSESRIIETEGCLSFPGLVLKVSRAAEIKVRYRDADFKEVECVFTGLFARCFQHELDHLNGITFTDRVTKLVLAMARKKQAQARRYR